jgi:hypothetical protein
VLQELLNRLADGAQYCSAHRLADLVCWHRCARRQRRHSNSALASHLHTIVLKMVEALGFTSAATAGLRQDILRFHQRQPYSEARSHAPKSSAATALRLSWNGRPVNSTLLLALLLADAISTLYRLTLDSRGTLRANQPGTSPRHSYFGDGIGPRYSSTASPHSQL